MTCGTPASTSATAGTSRSSPTPPASRSGSATSNQAPPTTSPPPANTPSRPLYPAAAKGLPPLTDKGYDGAGIGIHVLTKGRNLDVQTRTRNQIISSLRAPADRGNALLKSGWKALRRVTLCPWRIGTIITAALVLTTMHRGLR